MARANIPDWKSWMRSHAKDLGDPPAEVEAIREQIGVDMHGRKSFWRPIQRQGILALQPVHQTYTLGPFELPVDFFASSRWHPRRTRLPVTLTRADWEVAWRYWKTAASYQGIKTHIEKHGMRRPVIVEWFMNGNPKMKLAHGCFSTLGETPAHPFLVARTGNERILMGMFEWGWETITASVMIRDLGYNPVASALIKLTVQACPGDWKRGKGIYRRVEDKGGHYGGGFRFDGAGAPPEPEPTPADDKKRERRRRRRRHQKKR